MTTDDSHADRMLTLHRFMDLLRKNGEHRMFTLDGAPCWFVDWIGGEDYARLVLENRYGARFEIDPIRLRGRTFNEWIL